MNAIVIIISSIAVMAYIIAEYRDIRKNKQEELNKIQQERKTQQDYFNSTRMVLKMYKLSEQTHPDIDELKTVIKYHYTCNYDEMLRKACQLKLICEEKELTPLEATMTPVQLYHTGNPLWAKQFTANHIKIVLANEKEAYIEDLFQENLRDAQL